MLAAAGIHTALDVLEKGVDRPGIGWSAARAVNRWAKAAADAWQPILGASDESAIAARVDGELAAERARIEGELLDGPNNLRQLALQIENEGRRLKVMTDAAYYQLVQARIDARWW